jgi:hypothetical protein
VAYFIDLFSPETYEAFGRSDRTISGFRPQQRAVAARIRPGDKLVCYMTRVSRWVGLLEVVSEPFEDRTPIFVPEDDPFSLRFRVHCAIWLPPEKTIPIHAQEVWSQLSFTRHLAPASSAWSGRVRGSLTRLGDEDGALLERVLRSQSAGGADYPFSEAELRKLTAHRVRRADRDITVSVPEDEQEEDVTEETPPGSRESIKLQALLAEIGSRMGMDVWIPRSDRAAVSKEWRGDHAPILDRLPLNYDDTTLRTIEQIDVLWLRGRSIRRAFEVEHTTSVYSGILRMADLLALQPNMDIRLHIVAPEARRDKVFQEIRRPVFSLLDRGPLSESCTYISYDGVRALAEQPHLSHLSDSVLEEYEESTED